MKIYLLRKKDNRYKNVWKVIGVFDTYKQAQDNFIYKDGRYAINDVELNQMCDIPNYKVKETLPKYF